MCRTLWIAGCGENTVSCGPHGDSPSDVPTERFREGQVALVNETSLEQGRWLARTLHRRQQIQDGLVRGALDLGEVMVQSPLLTVEPEVPLTRNPRYAVTVSGDDRSLGENELDDDFTFSIHSEPLKLVNTYAGSPSDQWYDDNGAVAGLRDFVDPQTLVDSGVMIHPSNSEITSDYGPRDIVNFEYHYGIDYSAQGVVR